MTSRLNRLSTEKRASAMTSATGFHSPQIAECSSNVKITDTRLAYYRMASVSRLCTGSVVLYILRLMDIFQWLTHDLFPVIFNPFNNIGNAFIK